MPPRLAQSGLSGAAGLVPEDLIDRARDRAGAALHLDLVNNPDQLLDPFIGCRVAGWFFAVEKGLLPIADRFGQINLSQLGGTHQQPKTQMLGVRGFPGNTIYHPNSFFFPSHTTRVFVEQEVDMVSGAGYNPAKRISGGNYSGIDLRAIITNLCVLDFGGPDHSIRLVSLHPGVSVEDVSQATGFPLEIGHPGETPLPTAEQIEIIQELDPFNIRATAIKDNPPARRV